MLEITISVPAGWKSIDRHSPRLGSGNAAAAAGAANKAGSTSGIKCDDQAAGDMDDDADEDDNDVLKGAPDAECASSKAAASASITAGGGGATPSPIASACHLCSCARCCATDRLSGAPANSTTGGAAQRAQSYTRAVPSSAIVIRRRAPGACVWGQLVPGFQGKGVARNGWIYQNPGGAKSDPYG